MGVHKPRSRPGTPLIAGVQQAISGQGQWDVEIMDSQQKVSLWLGTFDTAEDAAKAYDEAARILRSVSAKTNFQLPGGRRRAGFSEDGEPFSFGVCGIEEPDSLLGALKAKLSDENNSNAVFHAKQQKQKQQQQQNINLLQLPHNFIDLSWSLPHASSKISNVGNLRMSDCSRGIKRNSDGRQVCTSNRGFHIVSISHYKEHNNNCVNDSIHNPDQIEVISSANFPETRTQQHSHSHTGKTRDIKCHEEVPDVQTWDDLHIIHQNHIQVPENRNTLPTTNVNATPITNSATIANQMADLLDSGNFDAEIESIYHYAREAAEMSGMLMQFPQPKWCEELNFAKSADT